jgi:hypothetical protein
MYKPSSHCLRTRFEHDSDIRRPNVRPTDVQTIVALFTHTIRTRFGHSASDVQTIVSLFTHTIRTRFGHSASDVQTIVALFTHTIRTRFGHSASERPSDRCTNHRLTVYAHDSNTIRTFGVRCTNHRRTVCAHDSNTIRTFGVRTPNHPSGARQRDARPMPRASRAR